MLSSFKRNHKEEYDLLYEGGEGVGVMGIIR